ncbi:hypothetical protein AB0878_48555 [Amycolatopsis sp. NPDC047767]|uniref:hypothetical protein n=1 Tax=Amycolatopsis sp. NPDC047767 TaxID=3156765 RepID=UPI00345527F9
MNFPTELAATDGAHVAVVVGIGALILLPVIFFVAALVSILGSPLTGGMRLVWVVFAFCAPFRGPLRPVRLSTGGATPWSARSTPAPTSAMAKPAPKKVQIEADRKPTSPTVPGGSRRSTSNVTRSHQSQRARHAPQAPDDPRIR